MGGRSSTTHSGGSNFSSIYLTPNSNEYLQDLISSSEAAPQHAHTPPEGTKS